MSAGDRLVDRIFGIDRRSLAALRIALGAVLIADLTLRAGSLIAMASDRGVFPRSVMDPWLRETAVPLHLLSGSVPHVLALHALTFGCAFALLVGRFTRMAAAASWLLMVSLHARNPLVLNLGDAILRVSLFWAMFLPLGSRWSLDAARSGRAPDPRPVCNVASAAFLLQVCFVYFFTAVEKSGPDWQATGLALYYALQLDWMALPPALWLREQLLATRLLTWATLVLEYLGPFLLLAPSWPIRLLAVLGFWAFHLGIAATLRIGIFPWVDIAVLAAFLPREVWDALETLVRRWLLVPTRRAEPNPVRAAAAQPLGRPRAPRVSSGLLAALLALIFAANLGEASDGFGLPDPIARALRALGLEQRWIMFSPEVPRLDGWFVLPGRLADGRLIDVSPHGPALDWRKPAHIASEIPTARWITLMHQLSNQNANGTYRRAWVRFLCREWNRSHPPAQRLERVDIFFMLELSVAPGQTPQIEPRYMASHPCPRRGEAPALGWDDTVVEAGAPPPPLVRPPVGEAG